VTLDREELFAMHEEILMRIALLEIAKEDAKALEKGLEDASDAGAPDPRALRIIEREIRRRKLKKIAKRTLPRAARVAAALVLLGYLSLTAVLATSARAREKFLTLFVNTTPYYSELSLNPIKPVYAVAPEGWTEKYYPEYIPEGWTLDIFDPVFGDVVYKLDEDHIFQFGVYDENASVNINTEGSTISHVSLNGIMSMVAENKKEGFTWVTWSTGDRMIVIYIDSDLDTALDIAVSVCEVEG
jgi:hypothetical protein